MRLQHAPPALAALALALAAAAAAATIPRSADAFVAPPSPSSSASAVRTTAFSSSSSSSSLALAALTERQLQFWEDVESGIEDVAAAYPDDSIDRIRTFAKSAQGAIPPPVGSAPGHQPSEEHVDGLTAKPFWDAADEADYFPWAAELEANSDIIAEEFARELKKAEEAVPALRKSEAGVEIAGSGGGEGSRGLFAGDSAWQNKVMGGGWSAFRLQRLGEWNTENCAKFPRTYQLLRSLNIPLAVRGVCFARQAPGSGVGAHTDGRNFILTSHLGLNVPAAPKKNSGSDSNEGSCWIKVGDQERTWTQGKLTTLDTSFEHSTGNPTEDVRDVLIVDFWHPELNQAERACLEYVYDLRNKFERGDVPVRKPRSLLLLNKEGEEEEEGQGLAGLWKALTGGGGGGGGGE